MPKLIASCCFASFAILMTLSVVGFSVVNSNNTGSTAGYFLLAGEFLTPILLFVAGKMLWTGEASIHPLIALVITVTLIFHLMAPFIPLMNIDAGDFILEARGTTINRPIIATYVVPILFALWVITKGLSNYARGADHD